MPIIEEQALLDLKNKIESLQTSNNDLKIELEEQDEALEGANKQKGIASVLAGVFLLAALTFLFLWLSKGASNSNAIVLQEGEQVLNEFQRDSIRNDAISNYVNDGIPASEDDSDQTPISGELIYAVQIAALEKNNISLTSDNLAQFQEVKKGEFYKYSLGAFSTLEEAQDFRKVLVRMGFDDAFVASYQNGKRVRIEEAY